MMMNNCVRSEVLRENFRPGTDTVAAIMWSNPVVLPPLCRVNEAIERVRQVGLPEENMNSCYVVAEDYTLLGLVSLRTLLLTRGGARLETVMSHPFATVQPQDDQELAAQLMQEYDLLELPVVENPCPANGRSRRQEVKELIAGLEGRYPDIKQKLFGSLQRYPLYGWNLHEEER